MEKHVRTMNPKPIKLLKILRYSLTNKKEHFSAMIQSMDAGARCCHIPTSYLRDFGQVAQSFVLQCLYLLNGTNKKYMFHRPPMKVNDIIP